MREKLWLIIYAFKNALIGMKRHWVLCLSSVTTVFLTLSLAAVLIIAELHVNRFSENLASDLEIHVVLNDDVLEQETIDSIAAQINDVDNVRETVFSDKDHELEMMIEQKESLLLHTVVKKIPSVMHSLLKSKMKLCLSQQDRRLL